MMESFDTLAETPLSDVTLPNHFASKPFQQPQIVRELNPDHPLAGYTTATIPTMKTVRDAHGQKMLVTGTPHMRIVPRLIAGDQFPVEAWTRNLWHHTHAEATVTPRIQHVPQVTIDPHDPAQRALADQYRQDPALERLVVRTFQPPQPMPRRAGPRRTAAPVTEWLEEQLPTRSEDDLETRFRPDARQHTDYAGAEKGYLNTDLVPPDTERMPFGVTKRWAAAFRFLEIAPRQWAIWHQTGAKPYEGTFVSEPDRLHFPHTAPTLDQAMQFLEPWAARHPQDPAVPLKDIAGIYERWEEKARNHQQVSSFYKQRFAQQIREAHLAATSPSPTPEPSHGPRL